MIKTKKGLGEFMGNSMFVLAGIIAAGAVLKYFGLEKAAAVSYSIAFKLPYVY
ncbi:hypothetical protein Desgi_4183 [Desulfoscipio gibsoniae DSM 7213]|uniref:Uncharacterized protein n=2 Tax=Desulfoscipio gibsoniae TaxID=102134 RepID=R4KJR4_9FIRM|nr:hypothetical protein Desgi_4183 [Desulfoscipio gibsoniae DSM 7213]